MAITEAGRPGPVRDEALTALAADLHGALLRPRDEGLLLSVRGGGHSAPGYGTNDGGLVIDLSLLKAITVDVDARTAQVGGGVLLRAMDEQSQRAGLATPGG